MDHLNSLDYSIILVYFAFLIALGMYLKNRASQSLDDYFLGGRRLPWWALGISGMASWLDIAGTMIIVSFLFMLGPRGLYVEFRGGAGLVLAIMLVFTGKWHRRSGVMTGAEWMVFRFGNGPGGKFARLAKAASAIILNIGMIAYLAKGVGLFLSMFLPFSPFTCSLIMIGVATLYTMASGFYGVVYTDIFQSFIIFSAVIIISILAFSKVTDVASLARIAGEVTGNSDWTSSRIPWHTTMPRGYESYSYLTVFAMFYLVRNILGGMGYGDDPKYFGARSDRECGLLSFMWEILMTIRWPLMMGCTVLGIFLVRDLFPDQGVLAQAADLIRSHVGEIDKSRWNELLAAIVHRPEDYPEIIAGLKSLFGTGWADKLHLLSYEGTINPERILPAVVLFNIPMGLRGLILIALVAASMSTFDSTVNMTTANFTRDIYQGFFRPKASNRELIFASWGFILFMVGTGFLMGFSIESINDIWGWIIMGIGGGLTIPTMIRFYWWRFNGGGFAVGTFVGLSCAVLQRMFFPGLDERIQFSSLMAISLLFTVLGTYLTPPTDRAVLETFYRKTRPFGFWGPFKKLLPDDQRESTRQEHFYDILVTPFVLLWQVTLLLLPMQVIIKAWNSFGITLAINLACLTAMYFFWYKKLPGA